MLMLKLELIPMLTTATWAPDGSYSPSIRAVRLGEQVIPKRHKRKVGEYLCVCVEGPCCLVEMMERACERSDAKAPVW